jgi:predicted membrane metal-binding protein
VTVRLGGAHVLAGALCGGLAAANLERLHVVGLGAAVAATAATVVIDSPGARLVGAAIALAAVGWWWGSARLDALDRSTLAADVGRSGRAVVVITSPTRKGRFDQRANGRVVSFRRERLNEPVQLELPLGRAPPQGAVVDALAVVAAPRGPSHGFDERTWLRRHGVHVVVKLDAWRAVGRRAGFSGFADRVRHDLMRSIAPGLGGERRAVLEGIVVGDDTALSDRLRSDFRRSGLYHILRVT